MLVYFKILGLEPDASDEAIRGRYLEMVKRHPPEKDPEAFKMISLAYEAVKDRRSRVRTRLFGIEGAAQSGDVIKALSLSMDIRRRTPSLGELVDMERQTKHKA